jgi:transcription-repair coupling factor (superfamily II helicase)
VLTARTAGGLERLAALLRGHGLRGLRGGGDADGRIDPATFQLEEGPLSRGFVLPADGLVCVTEEEIFGTRAPRPGRPRPAADPAALRALAAGDYVVHAVHGIGRYEGLERRVFDGVEIDLLRILYRDGDRLHVPVYHANQVAKYVGAPEPRLGPKGGAGVTPSRERYSIKIKATPKVIFMANDEYSFFLDIFFSKKYFF